MRFERVHSGEQDVSPGSFVALKVNAGLFPRGAEANPAARPSRVHSGGRLFIPDCGAIDAE